MNTQTILTENSYDTDFSHCYSYLSFTLLGADAKKITTRPATSKLISNKGHKNNRSEPDHWLEF